MFFFDVVQDYVSYALDLDILHLAYVKIFPWLSVGANGLCKRCALLKRANIGPFLMLMSFSIQGYSKDAAAELSL